MLNPFRALLWPRCKVCRSRFRRRLAFGAPFIGDYAGAVIFAGSLVVAIMLSDRRIAGVGLAVFILVEVLVFRVGRLYPDERDPVTTMQLRRYRR